MEHLMNEQSAIIENLGVAAEFDAAVEAERRIAFLSDYLLASGVSCVECGLEFRTIIERWHCALARRAVERMGRRPT
jgi:NAD+ synthase